MILAKLLHSEIAPMFERAPRSRPRTLLALALTTFMSFNSCRTAQRCAPAAAQESVVTTTADLVDRSREREVPIRVYFPRGAGRHPVVFFSHGLGESREAYVYLGEHLARSGYLAIHLTHRGSDRDLLENEGIFAVHRAVRDRENWINRPLDVTHVIDLLERNDERVRSVAARADLSNIAVVGHSAGAFTALTLAGAIVRGTERFHDERVKAAVAMSMPKLRPVFLPGAYDEIAIPVLHMTGTRDRSLIYWTFPSDRREPFESSPATPQHLVTIEGATHWTFSNPSRADRPCEQAMQRIVAEATTNFLDAYIRGSSTALERLRATPGARIEEK